jgi:hypothetical protein
MASVYNHLECPNCHAVWTQEEIEDQICDACNFPDHEEEFDPDKLGPDPEPREPDGEDFRGNEAANYEREQMDYCQRYLK